MPETIQFHKHNTILKDIFLPKYASTEFHLGDPQYSLVHVRIQAIGYVLGSSYMVKRSLTGIL